MPIVAGEKTTFSDATEHLLPVERTLKFLNPRNNAVGLLKRIGVGDGWDDTKLKWNETAVPVTQETMTFASGADTNPTVVDTGAYQINDLIKIDSEVVRVTALASGTVLTVSRAYAGTTGVAHAAKTGYNMGSADPEGANAPAGSEVVSTQLFNYMQTFTRLVDLSTDEIATLHAGGNPFNKQLAIKMVQFWRLVSNAMIQGVRFENTGLNIRSMGGLDQFITSSVTNVAGALTKAVIDAMILTAVQNYAGDEDGFVLACHPKQKIKMDYLNTAPTPTDYMLTKTGQNNVEAYKTGIMGEIPVFVDLAIPNDRLYLLNTSEITLRPLDGNGISGRAAVSDATTPGADNKKSVIRGKYTLQVELEKSHGYLYGLT